MYEAKLRRFLLLLLMVIMCCSFLSGCDTDSTQDEIMEQNHANESTTNSTTTATEETISVETLEITEEDTVIYSSNGIEVTYVKTKGTKYFSYQVTNNSDCDIQFSIGGVAVNNCMVSDMMAMGIVTSGNKAVEEYDLSGAKDYGIDDVETLDIYFVFYDHATYKTIDEVVCHVNVSNTSSFEYACSLPMFYDSEYVSAFVEMGGDEYEDFQVLYHNKSNEIISTALSEVSINGVMLTYNMKAACILPGCYAYTGAADGTTTLWDAVEGEIKDKCLEPIERIEGKVALWADVFDLGYQTTDNMVVYPIEN